MSGIVHGHYAGKAATLAIAAVILVIPIVFVIRDIAKRPDLRDRSWVETFGVLFPPLLIALLLVWSVLKHETR